MYELSEILQQFGDDHYLAKEQQKKLALSILRYARSEREGMTLEQARAIAKELFTLKSPFYDPTDIFYLTGMQLSLGRLLICSHSAILFVDGRYYEEAKKTACCKVKKMEEKEVLGLLSSQSWKELRVLGFDTSTSYLRVEKFKKQLQTLKKQRHLKIGYCRNLGAEGMSFTPIVAFGSGSALPHYHTSTRKLKKGDIVLMDLGVRLNGYASDMTRTFFFGEGTKQLQELYQVVEASKEAALNLCRPGVPLSEIDEAARKVMREARLEKHFLHSLGHGIGLDVHESPNFRTDETVLVPGMVITIEPGLYLPGKGGVRLEDMVVITKQGHRNLFR